MKLSSILKTAKNLLEFPVNSRVQQTGIKVLSAALSAGVRTQHQKVKVRKNWERRACEYLRVAGMSLNYGEHLEFMETLTDPVLLKNIFTKAVELAERDERKVEDLGGGSYIPVTNTVDFDEVDQH